MKITIKIFAGKKNRLTVPSSKPVEMFHFTVSQAQRNSFRRNTQGLILSLRGLQHPKNREHNEAESGEGKRNK